MATTSTMLDQINELGIHLNSMQEDFTIRTLEGKEVTKEEIEKQKMLTKQWKLMINTYNNLKKINKVGVINQTEFENVLNAIRTEKGTIGDIVQSTK